jgi:hypothetical protein
LWHGYFSFMPNTIFMKRQYPPLSQLRKEFSKNKIIPPEYEEPILQALTHYPELKNTNIEFKKSDDHPVPYGTTPAVSNIITGSQKRKYIVTLLEKAQPPTDSALFRNLPVEAKRGVIGHELGHIMQFSKQKLPTLLKTILKYSSPEETRKTERGADICAIEHGLGFELYTHARYIRSIPGYIEERKEININYLHPEEILDSMPSEQYPEIQGK